MGRRKGSKEERRIPNGQLLTELTKPFFNTTALSLYIPLTSDIVRDAKESKPITIGSLETIWESLKSISRRQKHNGADFPDEKAITDKKAAERAIQRINALIDLDLGCLALELASGEPVGRDAILTEIRQRLKQPGRKRIALSGMAGIGKTSLAQMVIRDPEIQADFSEEPGPCWIDLANDPDHWSEWSILAKKFGQPGLPDEIKRLYPELPTAAQIERLAKLLLAKRKALLIVDDAWKDQDFKDFDVDPPTGDVAVMYTTRNRELASRYGELPVELLDEKDSITVIERYLTTKSRNLISEYRLDTEPILRNKLAQALENLPLALVVACGLLSSSDPANYSVKQLLEELRLKKLPSEQTSDLLGQDEKWQSPLLTAKAPTDRKGFDTVLSILDLSLDRLGTDREWYVRLGAFDPDVNITEEEFLGFWFGNGPDFVVSEEDRQRGKDICLRLWNWSLVERSHHSSDKRTYKIHSLIRHHMRLVYRREYGHAKEG